MQPITSLVVVVGHTTEVESKRSQGPVVVWNTRAKWGGLSDNVRSPGSSLSSLRSAANSLYQSRWWTLRESLWTLLPRLGCMEKVSMSRSKRTKHGIMVREFLSTILVL